jgi:hypothetical protein
MEAIKSGKLLMLSGKEHVFTKESAFAMNLWLKWLNLGIEDEGVEFPLFTSDGKEYNVFRPSEIKKALETEEYNKNSHGL